MSKQDKPIRVAGYGRMSTDKQQLSPQVQEQMIRQWFDMQQKLGRWPGGAQFVGMFVDRGVTSRIDLLDRPVGQFLIPSLERGDIVVCAKYNRAFRSAADCERTLARANEAGIKLVFMDLNIDTSTANGQLLAGILAVVSKHERDLRSETTKEALRHLQRTGRPFSRTITGYKIVTRNGSKQFVPDKRDRKLAYACLRLTRQYPGEAATAIWGRLRKEYKTLGFDSQWFWKSCSRGKILRHAVAAALDFPKAPTQGISRALGYEVRTKDFVLQPQSDLDQIKCQVNAAIKEGKHVRN